MDPAVAPAHRPTLPELLAPLPRTVRRVLAGLGAAALLAVVLAIAIPGDDGVDVVNGSPIAFSFRHPPEMKPATLRPEEIVRLERRGENGLFLQSFVVQSLALPRYEGDVGGILPIVAAGEIESLRRRYAEFELVREGKTRVNEVAAYSVVFRARLEGTRRLYGRVVLLPEPVAGSRRGVRLVLESTPASGVSRAEDVGLRGSNKMPFRSFRFGTEKP